MPAPAAGSPGRTATTRPASTPLLAHVREKVVCNARSDTPFLRPEDAEIVKEQCEFGKLRLGSRCLSRSLLEGDAKVASLGRERGRLEDRLSEVREDPRCLDRKGRPSREKGEQLHVVDAFAATALTVEHLDNAEGLALALQRHGHDRVGHVAGALGDIRGEARILADVVDGDRLTGHERPARDPAICGDTQADGRLGATPSGDTELEFLLALVEERD